MEKKTVSVHAITIHMYWVIICALLVIIAIMGARYWHLQWSVDNFTKATMWMNQQEKPNGKVSDYGAIIATSAGQYVSSSELQSYVSMLSTQLKRDIVVVDKNKKVLAATLAESKGTTYTYDTKGEIHMTFSDGKVRNFSEKSETYPSGVELTIVPMRDVAGVITGAVLISSTEVFH